MLSFDDKLVMIERVIETNQKMEMTYLKTNDTKIQAGDYSAHGGRGKLLGKKFPCMLAYCTKRNKERMFNVARTLNLKET